MFLKQQISISERMISERSCDTKDWSNDAENSALHQRNKLHFKMYFKIKQFFFNCNNISQYYWFYCIFNQINAALVRKRDLKKSVLYIKTVHHLYPQ